MEWGRNNCASQQRIAQKYPLHRMISLISSSDGPYRTVRARWFRSFAFQDADVPSIVFVMKDTFEIRLYRWRCSRCPLGWYYQGYRAALSGIRTKHRPVITVLASVESKSKPLDLVSIIFISGLHSFIFISGLHSGCGSHPQSAERVSVWSVVPGEWKWRSRGRCTEQWEDQHCMVYGARTGQRHGRWRRHRKINCRSQKWEWYDECAELRSWTRSEMKE